MPEPWDITRFLFAHLDAIGARGMLRSHTAELAVLHVRPDFTIWTNGVVIWWLRDRRIEVYRVGELRDLVRLVLTRYRHRPRWPRGDRPYGRRHAA